MSEQDILDIFLKESGTAFCIVFEHVYNSKTYLVHFSTSVNLFSGNHLPKPYGQWNGIYHSIDLKHANKECSKMFKHLCKKIPEESKVGGQIWNSQSERFIRKRNV